MASTNIKLFDENKSNMMSDTEYGTNTQRANGVQTGVASSELQNKFQYQMSLVAYAIAQLMMANGRNAVDTDAVATFVGNLSSSIVQKVLDKASAADMVARTADGKWISPKLFGAAPKGDQYTITLTAAGWTETVDASDNTIFVHTFTAAGSTVNSQPNIEIDSQNFKLFSDAGTSLVYCENNNGTLRCIAVDAKPESDVTIKVTLTEVNKK